MLEQGRDVSVDNGGGQCGGELKMKGTCPRTSRTRGDNLEDNEKWRGRVRGLHGQWVTI